MDVRSVPRNLSVQFTLDQCKLILKLEYVPRTPSENKDTATEVLRIFSLRSETSSRYNSTNRVLDMEADASSNFSPAGCCFCPATLHRPLIK